MGVLERTEKQKSIIRKVTVVSLFSVLILGILLIWQASQLSGVNSAVQSQFGVGPIKLFQLEKAPIDGGIKGTISFLPGLIVYFFIWAVVAITWIMVKKK